jgi:hypothetical protein
MSSLYIVPSDLLLTSPPRAEWHAHGIPADLAQSLVAVYWTDSNAQRDFESMPDVLFLGEPWEPLPAAAAPLLASLETGDKTAKVAALPATDIPAVPETVASAIRRISWPGVRLSR